MVVILLSQRGLHIPVVNPPRALATQEESDSPRSCLGCMPVAMFQGTNGQVGRAVAKPEQATVYASKAPVYRTHRADLEKGHWASAFLVGA